MRTQPTWYIRQLENHNSRLDKEAILRAAWKKDYLSSLKDCVWH